MTGVLEDRGVVDIDDSCTERVRFKVQCASLEAAREIREALNDTLPSEDGRALTIGTKLAVVVDIDKAQYAIDIVVAHMPPIELFETEEAEELLVAAG